MTQPAILSIYGSHEKRTIKTGKSLTQQHFADECDINNIMARYEKTGMLIDPLNPPTRQPLFGDFIAMPSYQEAQNAIREGVELFESLPARIRKMFNNDPVAYCDFISDRSNLDQALEMGLVDSDYVTGIKAAEAAAEEEAAAKAAEKAAKKAAKTAVEPTEPA